jgi:predicted RNA binding protein YcfA (HicA-like mRNA interferase family)
MPISSKALVRALEDAGFVVVRQKGSHVQLRHPDGRATTVPAGRKDLSLPLLRAIERQSGVKVN